MKYLLVVLAFFTSVSANCGRCNPLYCKPCEVDIEGMTPLEKIEAQICCLQCQLSLLRVRIRKERYREQYFLFIDILESKYWKEKANADQCLADEVEMGIEELEAMKKELEE